MFIFDGLAAAAKKEQLLKERVTQTTLRPRIAAILFIEDAGSRLYSQLKKEAAERVGMEYHLYKFSLLDKAKKVVDTLDQLNNDAAVTGIIVQKPTQKVWSSHVPAEQGSEVKKAYTDWWQSLVTHIAIEKDVDGLHPNTLASVQQGTWLEQGRVLPATCQAVLEILVSYVGMNTSDHSTVSVSTDRELLRVLAQLKDKKIIILGKSDLLGKPLYYYLHNLGCDVEMIGKKELDQKLEAGVALTDADIVVSATGRPQLINAEMVKEGVAIIDVGEPQADVALESVKQKAAFITPVPGGVGPMTVVCLLQNALKLISR